MELKPNLRRQSDMKSLLISVAMILLVACGEAGPQETTTMRSVAPGSLPGSTIPMTTAPSKITGEVPAEMLAEVIADAADRAGVDTDQLDVVRSQAVEWSDGSLGCPRPGEFYTQAIVAGYWVELIGPEQVYDYRLDERGSFRLCEEPSEG